MTATWTVRPPLPDLRSMAARYDLTTRRVDAVGAIAVGSAHPGNAAIRRFAFEPSVLVGVGVNVITDGVPAVQVATEGLWPTSSPISSMFCTRCVTSSLPGATPSTRTARERWALERAWLFAATPPNI